ncbi:Ubiquitin interaction domain-containing protein [Madurella fahalii]|uniref:Ubiquitin interaction domain-containing protein n=1 Tax=Madurella fahalii TaxID=1157608 RepID=A0ABQ0G9H3_9PEZI
MSFAEKEAQVDMVMAIIDADRAMITHALQANNFNADTVVGEYYDSADKFRQKYGWDESAFSSNREGEDNSAGANAGPSFVIHPADDSQVIYGTEPNTFYGAGAPSRPPSRTNNRSPMSRLVDITASEFRTDTPSNRQEEEAQLQQALAESLQGSGIQSPQMSGVTSNGDTSVYFGPANRPDYDPDEWAMVRLKNDWKDPEPSLRMRKPGMPVFLRCPADSWEKHRIGALLMIFHEIPAARNALLQSGEPPAYGYGNNNNWWKGEAILPPGSEDEEGGWGPQPHWSDELHRLMAFLEASERSYGTAELLSRARHPGTLQTNDPEKDFFQSFFDQQLAMGARGNAEVLDSIVEVVTLNDPIPQGGDHFGLLDLQLTQDADSFESLYSALDNIFLADLRQAMENMGLARMAWVISASDVLTFRFQGDDGLRKPINIPETFYIDRYLKANSEQMLELQRDMMAVIGAHDRSAVKEESLIRWVNPQTRKIYDRRVLSKAAIRHCQEKIRKIKDRASWRGHEQTPAGSEEYYLPEHRGEPSLQPDEAEVVEYYEAKIRELEEKLSATEHVMNSSVLRERQVAQELTRKLEMLLTVPSTCERWNPTHKYTLRGVVKDPDTVFLRVHEPPPEQELISISDDLVPGENWWWKISCPTEGHAVEHTVVSYDAVVQEACGIGCLPILVYATDKALQQEKVPLSDALKSFVKFDNRHFKQELSQSDRHSHSPEKKRSAVLGTDSQSKRLQRSSSIDSMATNQASAGDFDEDMGDAPFDDDSMFGPVGDFARSEATGQHEIPDLMEMHPPSAAESSSARLTSLPTPPYDSDSDIIMEPGVSPALDPESARLAQVSLQDMKGSSGPKGPEMQERPDSPFLTRPSNGTANGAAAEPMAPGDHGKDSGIDPRVHGM